MLLDFTFHIQLPNQLETDLFLLGACTWPISSKGGNPKLDRKCTTNICLTDRSTVQCVAWVPNRGEKEWSQRETLARLKGLTKRKVPGDHLLRSWYSLQAGVAAFQIVHYISTFIMYRTVWSPERVYEDTKHSYWKERYFDLLSKPTKAKHSQAYVKIKYSMELSSDLPSVGPSPENSVTGVWELWSPGWDGAQWCCQTGMSWGRPDPATLMQQDLVLSALKVRLKYLFVYFFL